MICEKKKLIKELWQRAENTLFALYGETPDARMLNRFYNEKILLGNKDDIIFWDILADVRIEATHSGYLTNLTGTDLSCFVAYLMGASDINPLPLHYRCSECGKIEFVENKRLLPLDIADKPCDCGAMMRADGFDIPYEMHIAKSVPWVSLCVDSNFLNTAEKIVREKMKGVYRVGKLTKKDFVPLKFVFLPFEELSDFEEDIDTVDDKYFDFPKITIMAPTSYSAAKKITEATGINFCKIMVELSHSHLSKSNLISEFAKGNVDGIAGFDWKNLPLGDEYKNTLISASPQSSYDLLKFRGALNSGCTWLYNENETMKWASQIVDIPTYRDDLFIMLKDDVQIDTGLAFHLTNKISKGLHANKLTYNEHALLRHSGLPSWFFPYVDRVEFLSSKSATIGMLKIALAFMWYKVNYPDKFEM